MIIMLMVGCIFYNEKPTNSDITSNENTDSQDIDLDRIVNIDLSDVYEGMTMGMALDEFGPSRPSEMSSNYVLDCSWRINETEILYVIFESDDREVFWEKYKSGAFVLPNESVEYVNGIRRATENEMKVLTEWIRSHKAIYAYIVSNGETTVLFRKE